MPDERLMSQCQSVPDSEALRLPADTREVPESREIIKVVATS